MANLPQALMELVRHLHPGACASQAHILSIPLSGLYSQSSKTCPLGFNENAHNLGLSCPVSPELETSPCLVPSTLQKSAQPLSLQKQDLESL